MLVTISFVFAILSVSAQQRFIYCEITATQKYMNPSKIAIEVDFGQERSYWKDNRLKDEMTGKIKSFNSTMDAVNYLAEQGWELVSSYATYTGNQYAYHYVLKISV